MPVRDVAQVKAEIPDKLKRELFSRLALRNLKFTRWLQMQAREWLQHNEVCDKSNEDAA